ncbi:elongation factor P [Bradymonadaceae bacterium TMQ3]|uniref:Elongation factor P n=1 Tax=Lujinxingia sediminis TaxID=2480984 RepID=A0ABY0CQD9_9DELT|nr:elongation factor P [Lujinxingia sediminis]RDV37960.1 elongation factor P [Bradymonadaceae bacterium TMQ3]RVU42712.1 elongation factor P [Lujinxingia sediminis]TXC75262.1 elongation factor P [Bradymonadales bacterium TMQ1]
MISTQDFRKNLKIEIDGEPYVIIDCQHVKPGKGVAFVKTRIKSLISGRVLDQNYRSGDKVEAPNLESRTMQYLYPEDTFYVFMDTSTYEQIRLSKDAVEDVLPYLKDNLEVDVLFHNNKPISVEPPTFLVLEVTQTDPGFKGDTAQGATKPATLETGLTVQVPLYMEIGQMVKVDTRTGEFVERVNK